MISPYSTLPPLVHPHSAPGLYQRRLDRGVRILQTVLEGVVLGAFVADADRQDETEDIELESMKPRKTATRIACTVLPVPYLRIATEAVRSHPRGSQGKLALTLQGGFFNNGPARLYDRDVTRLLPLPRKGTLPRALLPWYLCFYLIRDSEKYK